jgi:hypothetical protein
MKLSWRDFVNTLLAVGGGAIVYAKFYDYSWSVISSWRSAVAVLAGTSLVMMLVSGFKFANRSILNVTEMLLGSLAIVLAVVGMIMTSEFVFYSLAGVMGVVWLLDTARHARHSWIGDEGYGTTTFHHAHSH